MSTANKLTYLNVTKQKLKQAINNIGGEVTDETTFRQYVNQLENAYDRLPKTEFEEGESVTLENTLKGKLDFQDGKVGFGQTEQDGTPTPDTPIAINSVTGEQDVVVSGKNLVPFPYSDGDVEDRNGVDWSVNSDGTINATGTANASSSIFYLASGDDDIYLDAGTYKILSNFSGTDFSWQVIQIVNGSYGTIYWDNMVLTETTRLRIRVIAKPNTTVNVQNAYLMIERGNQATTYEPYITPTTYQLSLGDIELCGIGDYKDELIYDVDEDKVYKNVNVGKQILNGDETITLSAISDNTVRIRYSYDLLPYTAKGDLLGLCNRLLAKNIWDIDAEGFFFYGKQLIMRINKETVGTTSTSINAWLENNNMIFNYALEEAVKQEITGTLKDQVKALYNAHSNNGTTIITSNGNLPMIIKVRGLKGE